MRTKTAAMFVAAILAMPATGCAAAYSGAGPEAPADVPAPELADDEVAISEEDSASRPRNEAAPTTAREFNGTEPNRANRPNGGQRTDPYLPPQAVVPDEPAPQPPTDADTAPSTPPETRERPRPSFPRVTDPVPLLPLPPFGADITPREPQTGDGNAGGAPATGTTDSEDPDPGQGGDTPGGAADATDPADDAGDAGDATDAVDDTADTAEDAVNDAARGRTPGNRIPGLR